MLKHFFCFLLFSTLFCYRSSDKIFLFSRLNNKCITKLLQSKYTNTFSVMFPCSLLTLSTEILLFFLNSFADTWHYPSKSDAVSRPSVVDSVFLISLRPNLAESEFSVQFLPNFTKSYRNFFVINSFSLRSLDNTDPHNKNCAQCSSCDIILPILLLEQKSLICIVKICFSKFCALIHPESFKKTKGEKLDGREEKKSFDNSNYNL